MRELALCLTLNGTSCVFSPGNALQQLLLTPQKVFVLELPSVWVYLLEVICVQLPVIQLSQARLLGHLENRRDMDQGTALRQPAAKLDGREDEFRFTEQSC